jgi:hypothetical protein
MEFETAEISNIAADPFFYLSFFALLYCALQRKSWPFAIVWLVI